MGLAASGTVTLELAMARVPYVAAYKVATVTHWLASILVQVPYANLINFISNREVVPECIQSRCEPDMLFGHICRLLDGAGAGQVNAMRVGTDGTTKMIRGLGIKRVSVGGVFPVTAAGDRRLLNLWHVSRRRFEKSNGDRRMFQFEQFRKP